MIKTFLRYDFAFILAVICLVSIPYSVLVFIFPKIPHTQYLFLIAMVFYRLFIFGPKNIEDRLKLKVSKYSGKSNQEKARLIDSVSIGKQGLIALNFLYILISSLILNRF